MLWELIDELEDAMGIYCSNSLLCLEESRTKEGFTDKLQSHTPPIHKLPVIQVVREWIKYQHELKEGLKQKSYSQS